ncbi:MAG: hypothetical protein K5894_04510 [Lachnospiraceae bacterium]|nr:hypothetical protein [Lachnospiraceae bacterium]
MIDEKQRQKEKILYCTVTKGNYDLYTDGAADFKIVDPVRRCYVSYHYDGSNWVAKSSFGK